MRPLINTMLFSLAAGSLSCSMSRFAYTPCSTSKQCRDAFGWGFSCNEEQLCDEVLPTPRCKETYPSDLLQRKSDFGDGIIIGLQFDKVDFEAEMNAAELAVHQVMRNEGLAGRPYGLVKCTNEENPEFDSFSQDEANLYVSEYLANEIGVVAIVGPATSDRVDAAYLAVEKYGTLVMSPTATSPSLTELDGVRSSYDDPGLLWRTAPPDDLQGRVLSDYLKREDIKQVALVVEEGPYGTALGVVFSAEFEFDGNTVDQLPFEAKSASDLDRQIDAAASANVDAVLFVSSEKSDSVAFLQAVVDDSNFDTTRIFFADGGKDTDIFDAVTGLDDGVLSRVQGTAPASAQTQVYENFADDYRAKYPGFSADQTPYTAFAYDAAWLVIYGTAWAHYNEGAMTGLGVARGLRQVSKPGSTEIDIGPTTWTTLFAQFENGSQVNVRGASGELDYDTDSGETSAPIEVWGVEAVGDSYGFVEIETIDP
jgi:ABC-type branched-subunit amino acid transport system substrate-binding protein